MSRKFFRLKLSSTMYLQTYPEPVHSVKIYVCHYSALTENEKSARKKGRYQYETNLLKLLNFGIEMKINLLKVITSKN
jgi:hypothetical protein